MRLDASLTEAEASKAEAEKALLEAGDESEAAALATAKQAILAEARERSDQARLKLGTFETAARMRSGRLGQIGNETVSWQRRRDGAAAQMETLDARQREIAAQLAEVTAAPDSFVQRRDALERGNRGRESAAQRRGRQAGGSADPASRSRQGAAAGGGSIVGRPRAAGPGRGAAQGIDRHRATRSSGRWWRRWTSRRARPLPRPVSSHRTRCRRNRRSRTRSSG